MAHSPCVNCQKVQVEFRHPQSWYCINCEPKAQARSDAQHSAYYKARWRAITRLIEAHRKHYERLLAEEREWGEKMSETRQAV
jgi:hypothetical protein